MKNSVLGFFVIFSVLFQSFSAISQTAVEFPSGTSREAAQVYLPEQYSTDKAWPVVMALHGFLGSGPWVSKYFGLDQKISERGFILVVPNGTKNSRNIRFWNATEACCDFEHQKVDDVAYLNELLDQVSAKYSVDAQRIFLMGHSNGGFMAHRFACEHGEKIAGIVSLAGLGLKNKKDCKSTEAVSVLQIHAEDDQTVFYNGDKKGFPGMKPYPGARETIQNWALHNGCQGPALKGPDLDLTISIPGNDAKPESWNVCKDGKKVALWSIEQFESPLHRAHIPTLKSDFTDRVLDFLFEGITSKP